MRMADQRGAARGGPIFRLFEQRFQAAGRPGADQAGFDAAVAQRDCATSVRAVVGELHVDAEIGARAAA